MAHANHPKVSDNHKVFQDRIQEWSELEALLENLGSELSVRFEERDAVARDYLEPARLMLESNELGLALDLYVCLAVDFGVTPAQAASLLEIARRMHSEVHIDILMEMA